MKQNNCSAFIPDFDKKWIRNYWKKLKKEIICWDDTEGKYWKSWENWPIRFKIIRKLRTAGNISLEAGRFELFSKRDCCNNSNYAVVCFQRVFRADIARSLSTVKGNGSFECSTIKVIPRWQGRGKGGVEREEWKGRVRTPYVPTLPARKSPFQQECMWSF